VNKFRLHPVTKFSTPGGQHGENLPTLVPKKVENLDLQQEVAVA
jgi:hypothetical protein